MANSQTIILEQISEVLKAAGVKADHIEGLEWMNDECGLSAKQMLNEALSRWLETGAVVHVARAQRKRAEREKVQLKKQRTAVAVARKVRRVAAVVDASIESAEPEADPKRTLFQRQLDASIENLFNEDFRAYLPPSLDPGV